MVSYAYYRDAYRGEEVPETAFSTWEARAAERLSAATCGRSDGELLAALAREQAGEAVSLLAGQVRHAVCAVAEVLYRAHADEKAGGALTRETVGGWTRAYAARDGRETARKIQAAQAVYLGSTGLLYRGR